MFVYEWLVLESRFGLLILSLYPMGSFVLGVEVDSVVEQVSHGCHGDVASCAHLE